MSIKGLIHLTKMEHLSNYSIEKLITDFGMYGTALIDLRPLIKLDDDEPRIEVSDDIKTFYSLISHKNGIILPCPDCKQKLVFFPKDWGNPARQMATGQAKKKDDGVVRIIISRSDANNEGQVVREIIDMPSPSAYLGNKILVSLTKNQAEKMSYPEVQDKIICESIENCRNIILSYAFEGRRDYRCSYNSSHTLFVDFRIFDPIAEIRREEIEAIYGGEDQNLINAYEYLSNCLIIQKVGQYPSIADLQMFDIEKYRSLLDKESYRDLTRAVGLFADGIGCGAFIYLRRILEKLVEQAHSKVKEHRDWDEDCYINAKFVDKISILEGQGIVIIPEVLNGIKTKIYGVLSKGVHENTDAECLELFPYMQFVIEQILDEQLRKKEHDMKIRDLTAKISSLK